MTDPTLLILSIGSVILTILASLKCIKSCSSLCCTIEIQDNNQSQTNNPSPRISKTPFARALQQKFTPRRPKPPAQPTDSADITTMV